MNPRILTPFPSTYYRVKLGNLRRLLENHEEPILNSLSNGSRLQWLAAVAARNS